MEPVTLTTERLLLRPVRARTIRPRCTRPARTPTSSAGRLSPRRTGRSTRRASSGQIVPDGWRARNDVHLRGAAARGRPLMGVGRGHRLRTASRAPARSASGRPRSTAAAATCGGRARGGALGLRQLGVDAPGVARGGRERGLPGGRPKAGFPSRGHAARGRAQQGHAGTPGSAPCSRPTWDCRAPHPDLPTRS